jgi:hypothetical protein
MKYTFCNSGNYFEFNPEDKIFPYSNKPSVTNLDFYKTIVLSSKRKDIYIMDEYGNQLWTDETYADYSKRFNKIKKQK